MIFFYVIDTETNGLSSTLHEITEISIIRVVDRMQYSRNIRVHKPENSNFDSLQITGKTMSDLYKGSEKIDVINEVEVLLNEDGSTPSHRCLIAHNAAFDRRFLCALWEKYNKQFPFHLYVDTIHLFKAYCKKQGIKSKANLKDATELMGIKKLGSAHNAIVDTRHTYLLWDKLTKELDWLEFAKCLPHNIEL